MRSNTWNISMPVLLFDLSWPLPSGRKMVYQFYIYTCIYTCKIICMYNVHIYYACICIVVLFTIRNSSRIMVLATYKHLSSEQYILTTLNKINVFITIQSLTKKTLKNYKKYMKSWYVSKLFRGLSPNQKPN